ncbi:MAG: aldo/keto reductase [Sulfobacillus thermotolerans]|uniref:NADP-dependent oxidoreductase domain-containing protein n=1 Tax=Sulfobacillus thermotolerans TaxID=338644 RepID=A0ABM6RUL9_9FIRM|nr:hypothetical protein BXT84_14910 [Sulfobacillus thermotolerans]MCY0909301.1 aldo/keto reductase [Sulfobacillus thermotolerans]
MEERLLGKTKQPVSLIGFGALEVGRTWGLGSPQDTERPNEQDATTLLHHVLDCGITLIDTAAAYHASEARIGQALTHRRAEYFLASKCGEHNREPGTYYDFSEEAIRTSIDESLIRLQTSQIDLMQIHFGPDPTRVLREGFTVKAMRDAREKGLVRFLGASCEPDIVPAIISLQDFDAIQLTYNLLDRQAEDAIKRAADNELGVMIRFPLAMGFLTPKRHAISQDSPKAQWAAQYLQIAHNDDALLIALALQFIARMPEVSSILVGTKNPVHLDTAIQALTVPLPSGMLDEAIRLKATV